MKKLILASGSPTRKKLFIEAGLIFDVDLSDYQEDMSLPLTPKELAKHLSKGKVEAVAKRHKKGIIVGADTFVVFDNKILGKPHTESKAKETLKMLSGKKHIVVTGFTILDVENNKNVSAAVETEVIFKDLSEKEINDYVATGEPLNKAGSYGILEGGSKFVKEIIGSKSNVAGLPMEAVLDELVSFDIY